MGARSRPRRAAGNGAAGAIDGATGAPDRATGAPDRATGAPDRATSSPDRAEGAPDGAGRSSLGLADLGALRESLRAREARRQEQARREAAQREAEQREGRLFRDAVADVAPLARRNRLVRPGPAVEPVARQTERDERAALAESLSDEIDIERLLEHDERLSFRRCGIGEDALLKLRRGHWVAQARLDLHGLRSDEARAAVARFLPQAVRDGLRCVRIIHGKGLGSIDRTPVLKDKVLRWLVQRDEVIAFCQAPPFAGGSGALLVLLRAPGSNARRTGKP
ncbi:MAG: Smr/MutS family protein [Burkholderiaceae bacterium]